MIKLRRNLVRIVTFLSIFLLGYFPSSATVYTVTEPADGNLPDGLPGSLREAIRLANFTSGADVIDLSNMAFVSTIDILPFVASDVQIVGPSNGVCIIGGCFLGSVLTITNTGSGDPIVELKNLSFQNGTGDGGGINISTANVTIRDCEITQNFGSQSIGAGLRVTNAIVSIFNSTIYNNANTGGIGGGIAVSGVSTLFVQNSTIAFNDAAVGGGVDIINPCTCNFDNCTVTGNISTGVGGGFYLNAGFLELNNSIVVNNDGQNGANLENDISVNHDSTQTRIRSTNGHNIIGDLTGFAFSPSANQSGNIIPTSISSVLDFPAVLANNGGATQTIALNACSQAIDAAASNASSADQRGVARVNTADIGAYEYPALITADATSCGPQSVQLTVSGGTSGANGYNWFDAPANGTLLQANSATFNTPILNTTTTFYVAESTALCPNPKRYPVTVTIFPIPPTPTITTNGTPTTICNNASITLTAQVSQGGLGFLWSPFGQNTQSITVSDQASYTVTVISADNCTAVSAPLQINVVPPPPTPTIFTSSGSQSACQGQAVTLFSSSANNNVWSPNGETTNSILVSTPGTYTVTVSSAPNCTSSASFTFSNFPTPPTPVITLSSGATPFCYGPGNNLTLSSDITSGIVWSTSETSPTVVIDTTGSYTVTFTDANNCSATSLPFNVVSNIPVVPTITANGDTTFCDGLNVVLTSSNALDYLWSVGGQVTNSITVSTSNSVTVTTTDINNCQATSLPKIVTVNQNITPVISPAGPITICDGDSTLLVSDALTGNLWSNGETTNSIYVKTSGIFTVIVAGCSLPSAPVEVFVNPSPVAPVISAQGPILFCNGGSVLITSQNAGGSLLWSDNTTTTSNITATTSGDYFLTETNAFNCSTTSDTINVVVNPLPTAPIIDAQGPTTFCNNGSVLLLSNIPSGVNWSNGQFSAGIIVNSTGDYSASITDANNCSSVSNIIHVEVNTPTTPIINADGPLTFCDGQSVNLTVDPAAVTYSWSNSINTPTQNVTQTVLGLTVTTTDVNNCSATSDPIDIIVNPIVIPTITPSGLVQICQGDAVTLTSSSTTGNLWSTGETTQSINVSTNAIITVQVLGCSQSSTPVEVVVNPLPNTPIITSPTNFSNCSNQNVTLTSSSAAGYFWSNGLGNSQSVQVSQAGSYTVTIFDNNTCSATSLPVAVTFNSIPASPVITAGNTSNTICQGGTLTLTSSYATGNNWSTGETTQQITINAGGTYSVSHTDANGCTSQLALINITEIPAVIPQITLNQPTTFCDGGSIILTSSIEAGNVWSTGETSQSIEVTQSGIITVSNSTCNINSNPVEITVNPNPATPIITANGSTNICQGNLLTITSSSTDSHLWSNGQTGNQINVTETGSYSEIVTNAFGCSASSNQIDVQVQTPPFVDLGNDIVQCGSSVNLSAGNNGAISYLWSNGESTQNINLTSSVTNLTVTITNACGVFVSQPIDVTINAAPIVNFGNNLVSCEAPILLDAGNAGSSFLWNTGAISQTITATVSGQYSVIVTNSANCSTVAFADVLINSGLPLINLGGNVTQCGGTVTLDAGNTGSTFLWSNSATTQTITVNQTTQNISVTVTNSCGTSTSTPVNVTINNNPIVDLGSDVAQCAGTLQLDAGNSGATNYSWTGPNGLINSNTQTISVSQTGQYSVVVFDANGCTGSDVILVNLDATLPIVNLGNDVIQCGGSVVLNAQNPGSTYLWSTAESTQTISASTTDVYFVAVTNGCGTTLSDPIIVIINDNPTVDLGNDISQCGGSVIINSGISGASNYAWSGPSPINSNTQSISVNQSGTYAVVVTDNNGCTGTDAIIVSIDNTSPVVDLGPDINQCGGTVTLNAGNSGSTYLWSNAGETTQTITVSNSGSYFVTVSAACGTTVSEPIQVNINPSPVVDIFNPSPVCNATVTLDAGNPGSTFLWTPGNQNSQQLVATQSGNFCVTVTNAFSCSTTTCTQVIINNNTPIVNLGSDINQCGGTVTLDAGNLGASFSWNFNNSNTQTITVSQSGTYIVVVDNGCGVNSDTINVNIGEAPVVVVDQLILGCNSAVLSINGQPSGTTYNWNNGAGNSSTFVANSSGTYTVVVTNSASCSITETIQVNIATQPPVVNLGNDTTVCGPICLDAGNVGSLYLWNNGVSLQQNCISQSGQYIVTVNNGCGSDSDTINVIVLPGINVDLGPDINQCGNLNAVTLDAGAQPSGSTFEWVNQNGDIVNASSTFTTSISGNYTVTVTSPNGCTAADNILVSITNTPPVVDLGNVNQTSCGTVTLDAGNPGSTFLWSNGQTTQTIEVSTSTISPLTVQVTNACGTTTSAPVNITILAPVIVNLGADVNQCGNPNPVVLNAGAQPNNSTFAWSNQDGPIANAGSTLSVLESGQYIVIVTSQNGCSNSDTVLVSITNTLPIVDLGNTNQTNCGPITLNAGNPGSTYVWSTSETTQSIVVSQTTSSAITVTVTNACGSTTSSPVNFTILEAANVSLGNDVNICGAAQTVTLTASPQPLGTTFAWADQNNPLLDIGNSIDVTASGSYIVFVVAPNGCTDSDTVLVSITNTLPIVDLGGTQTSCGPVTLDAGNPGSTYNWSTGATTQTIIISQTTTNVTVSVTNACGTTTTAPIDVTINTAPTVSLGNDVNLCNGAPNATLNATGQPLNSTFVWFNQNGQIANETNSSLLATASGTYWVVVTAANLCTASDTVLVSITNNLPVVDLGNANQTNCGTLTLNAGNPGSTYLWSVSGQTTQTIDITNSTNNITVAVTNACGTTTSSAVNITILQGASVSLGNDVNICGGPQNVTLTANTSEVNPTYAWFNGGTLMPLETNQTLVTSVSGSYSVVITSANGCTGTDTVLVSITNNLPIVDLGGNQSNCNSVTFDAGNPGSTYLWSVNSQTTQTITISQTTPNISVQVTNACGTTTSASVNATILPTPNINLGADITQCGGVVSLNAGIGFTGYNWFNLSNPSVSIGNTANISVNSAGTYAVSVTNGTCTDSDTIIVNYSSQLPTVNLGGPYDICFGTATLDAGNPGSTYLWNDINNSTTQQLVVNTSGTFTVTVSNFCGSASGSAVVNILNATPATITASGPTTFCQGGSVVLTANLGASYLWFPNGETTQSITVSTTGVYTCMVTYNNGCASSTPLTQVNVQAAPTTPTITANGPLTFCQGGNVTLTSSSLVNNVWSNGSLAQSIVVTNSGTYTVSTVTGSCSIVSANVVVVVNPKPSAVVNTQDPTTFCLGDTATLSVTASVSYQWFKVGLGGNPDILLNTTQTQDVVSSGDYYAIVTDINGCTKTSFPPTNIVVKDTVSKPIITRDGEISACGNGGSITLTSSSAINNSWSNGFTSQSILVTGAGNYFVTVDNGWCSKTSDTIKIDVTPGPPIVLTLTPKVYTPGDNNISVSGGTDGEIDLLVEGGVSPLLIQWVDSSNVNLATTEDLSGLKKGWYKVIVTDANGCSGKDSIYLKEPLPFKIPEGFTPNNDGKNDKFVIGAIENYPNNKFTVYNRWGNVVFNKDGYKNEWDGASNNGESLPEGTYFVTLEIPGKDLVKGFVDLRR